MYLAGPLPRILAASLDLVIRFVIYAALAVPAGILGPLGMGLFMMAIFAVEWGYPIYATPPANTFRGHRSGLCLGAPVLAAAAGRLGGMAGLKLGFAPIWPGRKTRLRALQDTARDSLGLFAGFFVMLVIAAFIEAFWSAKPLGTELKYAVGGALWLCVIGYFFIRRARPQRPAARHIPRPTLRGARQPLPRHQGLRAPLSSPGLFGRSSPVPTFNLEYS